MNRTDYLNGTITHRQYYGSIVAMRRFTFEPEFIARVCQALTSGDEHLNTLPLSEWDRLGRFLVCAWAFKAHGDKDTLSGRVCVLKEAARQAAEKSA